jgi:hypothetical protein
MLKNVKKNLHSQMALTIRTILALDTKISRREKTSIELGARAYLIVRQLMNNHSQHVLHVSLGT